jgi:hypothetical protein
VNAPVVLDTAAFGGLTTAGGDKKPTQQPSLSLFGAFGGTTDTNEEALERKAKAAETLFAFGELAKLQETNATAKSASKQPQSIFSFGQRAKVVSKIPSDKRASAASFTIVPTPELTAQPIFSFDASQVVPTGENNKTKASTSPKKGKSTNHRNIEHNTNDANTTTTNTNDDNNNTANEANGEKAADGEKEENEEEEEEENETDNEAVFRKIEQEADRNPHMSVARLRERAKQRAIVDASKELFGAGNQINIVGM